MCVCKCFIFHDLNVINEVMFFDMMTCCVNECSWTFYVYDINVIDYEWTLRNDAMIYEIKMWYVIKCL